MYMCVSFNVAANNRHSTQHMYCCIQEACVAQIDQTFFSMNLNTKQSHSSMLLNCPEMMQAVMKNL